MDRECTASHPFPGLDRCPVSEHLLGVGSPVCWSLPRGRRHPWPRSWAGGHLKQRAAGGGSARGVWLWPEPDVWLWEEEAHLVCLMCQLRSGPREGSEQSPGGRASPLRPLSSNLQKWGHLWTHEGELVPRCYEQAEKCSESVCSLFLSLAIVGHLCSLVDSTGAVTGVRTPVSGEMPWGQPHPPSLVRLRPVPNGCDLFQLKACAVAKESPS